MKKWISIPRRAWKDTESFRKDSKLWFWGVEVVGSALFGVVGGLLGGYYIPPNANVFWQNAYPTIGSAIGLIIGFIIVFIGILLWNLFRTPYRQRNEAIQLYNELSIEKDKITKERDSIQEAHTKTIPEINDLKLEVNRLQESAAKYKDEITYLKTQSRRASLEVSQVVWGFWHTGQRMRADRLISNEKLQRILLLNPESKDDIEIVAKRVGAIGEFQRIIREIRDTTNDALLNKKAIKWYPHHRESSFTIYDPTPIKGVDGILIPKSENAWIYLEVLIPNTGIDQWKDEIIHNKGNEKAQFEGYFKEYEDTWQNESISIPNQTNDKLKEVIAESKVAGEDLIRYFHEIRKLDLNHIDKNTIKTMVLTLQEKEKIYSDSLKSLEIQRLISGEEIARFVKQVENWIKLSVILFKAGDTLDVNSLNNFETFIIQSISKIDGISQTFQK
jgi:hypothetical protein